MSQFVRVTPTGRNMPPQLLLNTHCIDKLTEDSRGVVIVMKSAHAAEHIHIAEQSPYRRPRDDGRRKAGRITLTECLEGHPAQQTSFSLSDIRMIERTPSGGAVVRFGIDGSGRVEAFEGFDTVANMIESHAPVKLEKLVTDTVEAKPQTAKLKPVPKEPPQRKALRHRGKLIKNMENNNAKRATAQKAT